MAGSEETVFREEELTFQFESERVERTWVTAQYRSHLGRVSRMV